MLSRNAASRLMAFLTGLCVLYQDVIGKGFINGTIYCGKKFRKNANLTISCPPKHVLIHVDVVAYSKGVPVRTGQLIEDTNKCHWKEKCEIPYPMDTIISCLDSSAVVCLNFLTDKLEDLKVRRAKCVHEEYIKQLIQIKQKKTKTRSLNGESKKHKKRDKKGKSKGGRRRARRSPEKSRKQCRDILNNSRGIIRSHGMFPYSYTPRHMCRTSQLKLKVNQTRIYFFVVKMNGICEDDSLVIQTTGDKESNFSRIFDLNDFGEFVYEFNMTVKKRLTIKFTFSKTAVNGCGGFIICYRGIDNSKSQKCEDEKLVKDAYVSLCSENKCYEFDEECCSGNSDSCYYGEWIYTCPETTQSTKSSAKMSP